MTTIERPTGNPAETGAPTRNPAADAVANKQKNFATRPMTGDEYIDSLRDGREIWLHGERVEQALGTVVDALAIGREGKTGPAAPAG